MPDAPIYRFGLFRFDPQTGELERTDQDGRRQRRLRPKSAEVLHVLLRSPGELVPRDALVAAVWGDTVVEFDQAINACIREIRSALGDRASAPVYVETLARRGYRFLAPVSVEHPNGRSGSRPDVRGRSRRRGLPVVGLSLVLAAVAALAVFARLSAPDVDGIRVAVLPLVGGAQDAPHSASVATEELIAALARMDPTTLGVIARTSSEAVTRDGERARVIGERLGARFLVEGQARATPGGWDLDLRLIQADTESRVWADRLQGSGDVMARAARAIALATGAAAPSPRSTPARPEDPVARDFEQRARWLLHRHTMEDTRRALPLLDSALAIDSLHAPALAGRGEALLRLGRTLEGRDLLESALRLAPDLVGAEVSLGRSRLYTDGDPAGARVHLERARQLAPSDAGVKLVLGYLEAASGRADAARQEARTALLLDPAAAQVRGDVGWIFYYAGEPVEAARQCERLRAMRPESTTARRCLLFANLVANRPGIAAEHAGALAEAWGGPDGLPGALAQADARALPAFWSWMAESGCGSCPPIDRIRALAQLGRLAAARDALTSLSPAGALYVASDPALQALTGASP